MDGKRVRNGMHDPIPGELEEAASEVVSGAIEVHRHLGPGLLESVYERALRHELGLRGIKTIAQVPITVSYKGLDILGQRLDLLVEPGVVVELKSVDRLMDVHQRQLVSYLKSGGYRLGLLIIFNVRLLKDGLRRVVN
ncbi:MAG: GxxExxY protein [Phycisphaerae bacterium]